MLVVKEEPQSRDSRKKKKLIFEVEDSKEGPRDAVIYEDVA